jgi:hypothetical protein
LRFAGLEQAVGRAHQRMMRRRAPEHFAAQIHCLAAAVAVIGRHVVQQLAEGVDPALWTIRFGSKDRRHRPVQVLASLASALPVHPQHLLGVVQVVRMGALRQPVRSNPSRLEIVNRNRFVASQHGPAQSQPGTDDGER